MDIKAIAGAVCVNLVLVALLASGRVVSIVRRDGHDVGSRLVARRPNHKPVKASQSPHDLSLNRRTLSGKPAI